MIKKGRIYYSRTYRRLRRFGMKEIISVAAMIIPVLILFFVFLPKLTMFMSWAAVKVMSAQFKGILAQIVQMDMPFFGEIYIVEMPTVYPDKYQIFMNLIMMCIFFLVFGSGKRKGKPLPIFLMIVMVIHTINCLFLLFASNYFPYTAYQYSDLYIKQQIGIWFVFIILAGMVTGCMGRKGILIKCFAFLSIVVYSVAFGIIRYLLFLYILQKFSILYMALMFFVLGPFFDFLYLVGIYALFINRMEDVYSTEEGREEWLWS